jgi:hypothetical protein
MAVPCIHLLSIDTAPIGLQYKNKKYVIGFARSHMARKVQYNMTMPVSKAISLLPGLEPMMVKHDHSKVLVLDKDATLFVGKKADKITDNIMDHGICLDRMREEDFLNLPFYGSFGIIMPTKLIDESQEEFTFRCVAIDPVFDENEDFKGDLRALFG